VTLTRLIPERHRSLVAELVTFGTVGAINTALGQVMFNVFFGLGYLVSTTISTAIATVCSFVLNRHITYRHRPRTSLRRELPLFTLLNLIGLGIQLTILAGAKHVFDLNSSDRLELNIARFGAVIVGTVFLLITYRTLVFKKAPVEVVSAAADAANVPAPTVSVGTDEPADTEEQFAVLTDSLEVEFAPEIDEPSGQPLEDQPAAAR
jgi:putative flippase GtrA